MYNSNLCENVLYYAVRRYDRAPVFFRCFFKRTRCTSFSYLPGKAMLFMCVCVCVREKEIEREREREKERERERDRERERESKIICDVFVFVSFSVIVGAKFTRFAFFNSCTSKYYLRCRRTARIIASEKLRFVQIFR